MIIEKTKDHYLFLRSKRVPIEASFQELMDDPKFRLKIVEMMYTANTTLRRQLNSINESLESDYQIKPVILVDKNYGSAFVIRCYIENTEYVGTTITKETIKDNHFIGIRLIDFLYEDHEYLVKLLESHNPQKPKESTAHAK